ncbi:MAG TPA: hypothetical protein VGF36_04660 [Rhodopila sp.]
MRKTLGFRALIPASCLFAVVGTFSIAGAPSLARAATFSDPSTRAVAEAVRDARERTQDQTWRRQGQRVYARHPGRWRSYGYYDE